MLESQIFTSDGVEDPYKHLRPIVELCRTFRLRAFTYDKMELCRTSNAKTLLLYYPSCTFDTWNKLLNVFLNRFYPKRKTYGAMRVIVSFNQKLGESLVKAYWRCHSLLNNFPYHNLPSWMLLFFLWRTKWWMKNKIRPSFRKNFY